MYQYQPNDPINNILGALVFLGLIYLWAKERRDKLIYMKNDVYERMY